MTVGTWTPGEPPHLEAEILPANVVQALFNITPSATDESGRNQMQDGDTMYGVGIQETFEVAFTLSC